MTDPVQRVLDLLQGVKQAGSAKWQARCPAHDDQHASLSVARGDNGGALVHCHAGCSTTDVCRKLGLSTSDLFAAQAGGGGLEGRAGRYSAPRVYGTPSDAADAVARQTGGTFATSWTYHRADGTEAFSVLRFAKPDGKKEYRPVSRYGEGYAIRDPSGPLPLYRLPDLAHAERVWVVEGEKCADAAAGIGLTTTTSAHGAEAAARSDWTPLAGRDVVILPDNDSAGRKYANEVAKILRGLDPPATVRSVFLPGLPEKGDIADYIDGRDSQDAEDLKREIERLAEAAPERTPVGGPEASGPLLPAFKSVRQLLKDYPSLREPVIHGLVRAGETMNIIAPPKRGKSWLVIDLALCVATGRPWLDQFETAKGGVLIIDNELHAETSTNRLPRVAEARGVSFEEISDTVHVENLRGRLVDLFALKPYFDAIEPGRFKIIILDAFYRFIPRDTDENDNGSVAQLYNCLDHYAQRLNCCFVLIHHTSKGNQSSKAVTDVGAGAGSQSRATDTHLVLRNHEAEDVVVLDAAVRSWPPVNSLCIRWSFPIWTPALELDPASLKREGNRRTKTDQKAADKNPQEEKLAERKWTTDAFVAHFLAETPRSRAAVLDNAENLGISQRRTEELLKRAVDLGKAHLWKFGQNKPKKYATVSQPLIDVGTPAPKKKGRKRK